MKLTIYLSIVAKILINKRNVQRQVMTGDLVTGIRLKVSSIFYITTKMFQKSFNHRNQT